MGSSRRTGSPLRALVSLAFGVLLIFGFAHYGPSLSTFAGDRIAKRMVDGVRKPNHTELAAWNKAADDKFVPVMHRRFPGLVQGMPDTKVAQVATHTCTVLDGHSYTPHYQATLRRDTRTVLTHGQVKPTRKKVDAVIRIAGNTTCPDKNHLASQFE